MFGNVGDNATEMLLKNARWPIAVFAISLAMVACAPAASESAAVAATAGSVVTAPAPLAPPSPEVPESTTGTDSFAGEEGGLLAPAGSINLGDLTEESDSVAAGDPVELPAPGPPDPLAAAVQLAREDLSVRLQLDILKTAFVEADEVTWSDLSLGCPRANTGYLAEETAGFKIVLAAGGENYTYHTDLGRNVVLCIDGEPAPMLE